MDYKIEVDEIGKYIEYLKKFKKKLEKDLADFEVNVKNAHEHWDDNNYELTVSAKDKIASEQKKLISGITTALKKLSLMYEEYSKYLRRKP